MGSVVVGLLLGAGLMFALGGGHHVSLTWHQEGLLVLT
jgi:hypothetical protein